MQLVADANVLLSAVIGGRAKAILQNRNVEQVCTPAATYDELYEHLPRLARRRRLRLETLLLTLASLPVEVVDAAEYERKMSEARRRIAVRDPDDVDVLALALERAWPVWSNDNDFEVARVEWYTTAELLQRFS